MDNIRNFCIISHIDHGKSTLADRFLELTKTVDLKKMRPQYLDMMDLEQEKGITIKMQPVQMYYTQEGKLYTLNLIDTPGHVDFNYEVSRSLAAVEGAILLIDATKGIQAQTMANLELAKKQNLVILPVINKIDLPQARIEQTEKEISDLLQIKSGEIYKISAKNGEGVEQLLQAILQKIPSPLPACIQKAEETAISRALIFDSKYDPYQGVIAFVRVFDGEIKRGEKIYLVQAKTGGDAKEVGLFKPELTPASKLKSGEIGYIATGIKQPGKIRIGDTITNLKPFFCSSSCPKRENELKTLPGYKEPTSVVFLSIYPENPDDFKFLSQTLEKLRLNDAALSFKPELKQGLGRGFQCGFLGLLHAEIVAERLKREFNLNLVLSAPQVVYKILTNEKEEFFLRTPADWPENVAKIKQSQELWIKLQILTPLNYLGSILKLLESIEGKADKTNYYAWQKAELIYEVPLREIITKNFYDRLKGFSQGFASLNYTILDWRPVQLQKLDILILGKKEEAFSKILPQEEIFREGKKMVERLKQVLPPQQFSVPLQAAIGGKIIARETVRAQRKDVVAPLYGGDYSRKRKLLEKQKKGKKELQTKAKLKIPSKVFLEVLKA